MTTPNPYLNLKPERRKEVRISVANALIAKEIPMPNPQEFDQLVQRIFFYALCGHADDVAFRLSNSGQAGLELSRMTMDRRLNVVDRGEPGDPVIAPFQPDHMG